MKTLQLRGGKTIYPIGMGTSGIHPELFQEHVRVLQAGIQAGANFIDTAENYVHGTAERIVGTAIEGYERESLCVATKVSPEHLSFDNVVDSCKESLERLGTDYVDIYQIHWPNISIPLEETLSAMEYLLDEKRIRFVGLSNFSFAQILEAYDRLGDSLGSIQMEYNLLERGVEEVVIPFCNATNTLFIAYTPLCQGTFNKKAPSLSKVAGKYGMSVSQAVLQWIVRHPSAIAIPKSSSISHTVENISSEKFSLNKEDHDEISHDFFYEVVSILPKDILCKYAGGYEKRIGYRTIEEAIINKNHLVPSPLELARELLVTRQLLKPVQVTLSLEQPDRWELINGNGRYWAWVLAFGYSTTINCIVKKELSYG